MGKTIYMLKTKSDSKKDVLCVAGTKKDLYLEMKADIFRKEFEDFYTVDFIKKNMPFFEYTSFLLPLEIKEELNQYHIIKTELKENYEAAV